MSTERDEGFVEALDAVQEYLGLQARLADALRAGFLSLAQARYSMGSDRVSALQFPALMTATARLLAAGDGELALAKGLPPLGIAGSTANSAEPSPVSSGSSAGDWASSAVPSTHAASGSARDMAPAKAGPAAAGSCTRAQAGQRSADALPIAPAAAPAEDAAVQEQLQRLRLAAQQSDDLLQQLAAKYGCKAGGQGDDGSQGAADGAHAGVGGGEEDEEYAEVAPPGRPLSWFGTLVAPSLREAEAHFGEALVLAVQAANAQRRLRQGVDAWRAAGGSTASQA